MKHCVALAKCCQAGTVAQRSWCGLVVAAPQPRDTKETELPGTGGWRGALWAPGWSLKALLAVTACSLMGSVGPQVKFSMYLRYIRAIGLCFTFWTVVGYAGQYVAYTGTNLWLSDWTEDSQRYQNETYPTQLRDLRIGVFGALGMAQGECGRTTVPTHLICMVQEGYDSQSLQPAVQ